MNKNLFLIITLFTGILCGCSTTLEAKTDSLVSNEIYKNAVSKGQSVKAVTVTNPGHFFRHSETIAVEAAADMTVYDLQTNKLLITQSLDSQLLFQTDLAPGQKKTFWIMPKPDDLSIPTSEKITYCRFVPERKDDFVWENDKVCNRMYGPALEYETITCGIDAWGKCVPYPVFDKIIKAYNEEKISYHENHGEGGDFFKVGNTLGCGGMAPFINNKVCLSPHNFKQWKVIANGPIRSIFELSYQPWQAGPYTISERKRISIDLGSNFTRVECHYDSEDTKNLPLAAGIILRDSSDKVWSADQMIAYWLPADSNAGNMGCSVIFSDKYQTKRVESDSHLLLTLNHDISKPIVYYAGSCWDENDAFSTYEKWQMYLKNFKKSLETPVNVQLKVIN